MNSKVFAVALAIITVTTAWSGQALATQPGNNGGGNGGCGVGQQTNGCGTATGGGATTVTANPTASASAGALAGAAAISTSTGGTGYGGAGGQGGAGGKGGDGGNAAAVQGQQQGQGQNQSNTSANTNSVNGYGGQATGNGAGNSTNVNIGGDTYEAARIPVATAYAAPLTSSNGTCMGSTSGGGQAPVFGVSFATTWTDSGCDARYDATALVQAGMQKAAIERLCLKPEIAQAMKTAGTPCEADRAKPSVPARKAAEADTAPSQVVYADPIIRARLGLPPLK